MSEQNEKVLLRPIGDRVVVEREKEADVSAGGIIIPEAAQEKPQRGRVVAVGKGALADDGQFRPVDVQVGELVLFGKYAGSDVSVGGKEYLVIRETDILAAIGE